MRDVNYSEYLKNVRQIGARATVTDTLLRFDAYPASESITPFSYDADDYSGGIQRAASVAGASYQDLYLAYHTADDANFRDTTWSYVAGVELMTGSRVAVFGGRIFFQQSDGSLAYVDRSGAGVTAPVGLGFSSAYPMAVAPVSADDIYALVLKSDGSAYKVVEAHYLSGGTDTLWEGRVYGVFGQFGRVDAVRVADADYVYLMDGTNYRAIYLKRKGDWWSEVSPVLPIDVVDDTSLFRLTGVSLLNGQVFLTGVLKRSYGVAMTCYLIGPEDVTMGREFFIRQEGTDGEGKLHLFDGKLWYVGPALRFAAEPTTFVGVSNPAKTTTVGMAKGSLSAAPNNPFVFQADLAASSLHPAMAPGAEVVFETIVNGQAAKLGTFSLDMVGPSKNMAGAGLNVSASSQAIKKLSQWESDASYDYLSQAKLSCIPSDIGKLIRVGGRWATDGDWLYPDYFNEDGYLYSSEVPNRSGIAVGRFKRMSNEYDPQFGLGLNYYRENSYDASQRLGRDAEESEYGSNGVFALYGSSEHNPLEGGNAGHGFGIYIVEDSLWHKQTSFSYDLPLDTETWFSLKVIDGLVELYARTGAAWGMVGSYQLEGYDHLPWKRDELGRGAAFLRNATPALELLFLRLPGRLHPGRRQLGVSGLGNRDRRRRGNRLYREEHQRECLWLAVPVRLPVLQLPHDWPERGQLRR